MGGHRARGEMRRAMAIAAGFLVVTAVAASVRAQPSRPVVFVVPVDGVIDL
ncbi:MAG: hypothetical protein HYV62_12395, partial [Candidatus Rokubacteria bacterium]|nr:hypothetical protein [Candidatus Rokubacteria bacterium]